jgi:hypothetical protein
MTWIKKLTAVTVLVALSPVAARACAVCYGEPDSPAARGLTWAIIALAAIVMVVLAGAVTFFVQANRKATVLEAAEAATSMIEKN